MDEIIFRDMFAEITDASLTRLAVTDPKDGERVILTLDSIKFISDWYAVYCAKLAASDCTCKAQDSNSGIDL
jgi:hypothetical protein